MQNSIFLDFYFQPKAVCVYSVNRPFLLGNGRLNYRINSFQVDYAEW